ncbi:hypothetical protein GCM10011324_43420 [Allosediminivita pacifica]|nr:hypothetical protein GCM10011324_43420 [Allosediminivita pacifica]
MRHETLPFAARLDAQFHLLARCLRQMKGPVDIGHHQRAGRDPAAELSRERLSYAVNGLKSLDAKAFIAGCTRAI